MKAIMKLIGLVMLTGMVFLSACGNDDEISVQEEQLRKLSGTWVVTSATMGGVDYTSEYADFELTLSGSSSSSTSAYGTVGRPSLSPWPAGGTWVFGNDVKTMMIRDSGTTNQLPMTYAVTDTQLTIAFQFTGDGYNARVNSVSGNWSYTLSKK